MDANVLTDHSTGKTYNLQEIGEVRRGCLRLRLACGSEVMRTV